MSTCQLWKAHSSDYVEGALSKSEQREFDDHLASCTACMQSVESLRLLRQKLVNLPKVETNPDFHTVLNARIGMDRRQLDWRFGSYLERFKVPAFALSMAALVIFLHHMI